MKFINFLLGACTFSFLAHASYDFEAGPIWDNKHAQEVCPAVCDDEDLIWDGNWHTTVWDEMSVCTCSDYVNQQEQTWQQSSK